MTSGDIEAVGRTLAALSSFLVPLYRVVGPDLKAAAVLMAVAQLAPGPAHLSSTADAVAAVTGLSSTMVGRRIRKLRALGLIERRRGAYRLSSGGRHAVQLCARRTASMFLSPQTAMVAPSEKL